MNARLLLFESAFLVVLNARCFLNARLFCVVERELLLLDACFVVARAFMFLLHARLFCVVECGFDFVLWNARVFV